jgi:hypothetical protein
MANKYIQFWKFMTEETVIDISSRYETRLYNTLPDNLVMITTRKGLAEYRDMLEGAAVNISDIDEFLCFLVRTSNQEGEVFIEEAWGVDTEVPHPSSKCFKLL